MLIVKLILLHAPSDQLLSLFLKLNYRPDEYFWKLRLLRDYQIDATDYPTSRAETIYQSYYSYITIPAKKVTIDDNEINTFLDGKFNRVLLQPHDVVKFRSKIYLTQNVPIWAESESEKKEFRSWQPNIPVSFPAFFASNQDNGKIRVGLNHKIGINVYNDTFTYTQFHINERYYNEILKNTTVRDNSYKHKFKSYVDLFEGKRIYLYFNSELIIKNNKVGVVGTGVWLNTFHYSRFPRSLGIENNEDALYLIPPPN